MSKKPQRKLSKTLTKRTRLTPDQLARVKGEAGEGLASRYTKEGEQSLELTRKLAKARKRARKFILYSDLLGKRVYVSKTLEDFPLTFDKEEARLFYEGFDSHEEKLTYWNKKFPQLKFKTTHERNANARSANHI